MNSPSGSSLGASYDTSCGHSVEPPIQCDEIHYEVGNP